MADKSIKKNYIFNLIYQMLLIVAPLITTPYVSRIFGPEGTGLYSYTNSIVTYFTLVAVLGTATFGNRKIGYVQNDPEARSRAFWELYIFRLIVSGVTLAVYLVLFTVIFSQDTLIYLILSLNIVNIALDVSWFLQGMEEFGKTVSINIILKTVSTALIFVLVKTPGDLPIYILLLVSCIVLGNAILWVYMPKHLKKVRGIRPFRDIKGIIQLFIPTVAVQVYTVLDKSMIGWFTEGNAENGYYEQAEKIVKVALTLITSLGTVMIPRISRKFAEGDIGSIKYYIYKSYRFLWMLGVPLALGIVVVSSIFVPVYFGDGYEKCIILLQLFSLLVFFIGSGHVTGLQFLVPTSQQNVFTLSVVFGAVANLILNLFLIPRFYSVGACVSSVIAELIVCSTQLIYVHKTKQLELKPVFSSCPKYIISGGVMCGVLILIKSFMPISWWALAVLIGSGVAIYFLCLLVLKDKFFIELVRKTLSTVLKVFKRNRDTADSAKEVSSSGEENNI